MQWLGKSEITPEQLSVNAQHSLVNVKMLHLGVSSGGKCEQTFFAPTLDFLEGYKIAICLQNKPNSWKKKLFLSHFFIPVINTPYWAVSCSLLSNQ